MNEILDELRGIKSDMNDRFSTMEIKMSTFEKNIATIHDTMATKMDIVAIHDTMANKADIVAIHDTMANKADIAELPYLSRAIVEINERTERIEQSMLTKEDLLYVHTKLMEHDHDIFKLKQRII